MVERKRRKVELLLPIELLKRLEPVLAGRKLKLEDVVQLYLRSLVNTAGAALNPDDDMPIGKYRGATVGSVIRTEPRYVGWLLAQPSISLKLSPESLELLELVVEGTDDV